MLKKTKIYLQAWAATVANVISAEERPSQVLYVYDVCKHQNSKETRVMPYPPCVKLEIQLSSFFSLSLASVSISSNGRTKQYTSNLELSMVEMRVTFIKDLRIAQLSTSLKQQTIVCNFCPFFHPN